MTKTWTIPDPYSQPATSRERAFADRAWRLRPDWMTEHLLQRAERGDYAAAEELDRRLMAQ